MGRFGLASFQWSKLTCIPATLLIFFIYNNVLTEARERYWSNFINDKRSLEFPLPEETKAKSSPFSDFNLNDLQPKHPHHNKQNVFHKHSPHDKKHKGRRQQHNRNSHLPSQHHEEGDLNPWHRGVDFVAYQKHDVVPPQKQTFIHPSNISSEFDLDRNKVHLRLGKGLEGFDPFADDDKTMGTPPGPHFDRSLPRNISVQTGKTAVLSCRVLNRDNRKVAWIRHGDLHILTVDKYKYSTDERVSVIHNVLNKEWVLRIKGALHSDAGKYECQVSTKPVLSYIVNLEVVVPRAQILNSPDIFVHRGSSINLTCVVNHGTDHPVFIYWYQNKEMVNIDDARTTLRMSTEERGKTVSSLLMKKAQSGDSGRYTCKPSNGKPAKAILHILNGELQAAMQTNKGSKRKPSFGISITIISVNIILLLRN